MRGYFLDNLLIQQISVKVIRHESIFNVRATRICLVQPLNLVLPITTFSNTEIGDWTHTSIDKGVSKDQLFRGYVRLLV